MRVYSIKMNTDEFREPRTAQNCKTARNHLLTENTALKHA